MRPTGALGRTISGGFDRGLNTLVDSVGPFVREASVALREVQTGYVRNYALLIFGGAVLLVGFMVFSLYYL